MKLRLPVLVVLGLLTTTSMRAKFISLNADTLWWDAPTYESTKMLAAGNSSDYQSEVIPKWKLWLESEELSTFGPLTLGLLLLFLPVSFSRGRIKSLPDAPQEDGDSNLQRIGRSWDPRF